MTGSLRPMLLSIISLLLITLNSSVSAQTFPLKINCGNIDPVGDWTADQYFQSGFYDNGNRCGNGQDVQFCKMRSLSQNGFRGYKIPVPNGVYSVVLHFMENYWNVPNKRIFDIVLEGIVVAPGYDIAGEAPGRHVPVSVTFQTTVTDGELSIELSKIQGNPMISGIEVEEGTLDDPSISPAPVTSAPTDSPTTAPILETAAPVATTNAPTATPVPETAAPVTTTSSPTTAPVRATAAPVAPTETPTVPETLDDVTSAPTSSGVVKQLLLTYAGVNPSNTIGVLKDGDVINFQETGNQLSVLADTTSEAAKVIFLYNGITHVEGLPVWAMAGNNGSNHYVVGYLGTVGQKTLTVNVYSDSGATNLIDTLTISFTIVDVTPTVSPTLAPVLVPVPTLAPVPAPTKAPTKQPTLAPSLPPVPGSTNAPTNAPTLAPSAAPVSPTEPPTDPPVLAPPTDTPTDAPVPATVAPVVLTAPPSDSPTPAPILLTAAPTFPQTPSPTSSGVVKQLLLTYAGVNPSNTIGVLKDGDVINFQETGNQLSVLADTTSEAAKVIFLYNGITHVEGLPVWAMAGNNGSNHYVVGYLGTVGQKTLTVNVYSDSGATNLIDTLTISFTIVDVAPTVAPALAPVLVPVPTLAPVPAPTKAPTKQPTLAPSLPPVPGSTNAPTIQPTKAPTKAPTEAPTLLPTDSPTSAPTRSPSSFPPLSQGVWVEVNANANIEQRHEACFVMVDNPSKGKRAYLVGGRGSKATNIYNPYSRQWTAGAAPPIEIHHMQCVEAQGLLWIVAAWTGPYPREDNADFVYVYDPASDSWSTRTPMPENRRRGAAAVVVVGDNIYVSHGNFGGHEVPGGGDTATSVGWIDYYNIPSDTWTALSNNAPNPRDHAGGALIGDSICVAGGRDGGYCATYNDCWPSVEPTDCYDLATGTWSVQANIPQKRAGASYGTTCDGKLMVAGGEGEGQAWNQVDVFDGSSWETIDDLVVQRHGSGLAIDCECEQIHIASGCSAPGGTPEIKSVETFFYSGVDTTCDPGPTSAPTSAPTPPPTTPAPVPPPTQAPTTAPTPFNAILINVGGNDYTEIGGAGRTWIKDVYATGGITYNDSKNDILGTIEDTLYHSERYGPSFSYEIPVPTATYEVSLLFAEIYWTTTGQRTFNVNVEGETRENIDIVALAGGALTAMSLEFAVVVQDGYLSISLSQSLPENELAKLSGIEVKLVGPHLAHAVTAGPYVAVDFTDDGDDTALVNVDGGPSHTHGTNLFLTSWEWKEGSTVLATTPAATFELDVGVHTVALEVVDNENNQSIEETTITVFAFGYPVIQLLTPSSGSIAGGYTVTITGVGFTYSAAETTVIFGVQSFTGSEITVINDTTISLVVPSTSVGAPVEVAVTTPRGTSVSALFVYEGAMDIKFTSAKLLDLDSPSVGAFGPNGCLYVGTSDGKLAKYTLNDDFTDFDDSVVAIVAPSRAVMGIAFDPLDPNPQDPAVYISHNEFFHKDSATSSGKSINGAISRVTGANFETVVDVITGLPVSDHDHGVNGLEFGHNGELYIVIGGATNGGIPGQISSSQQQKENYYSAAVLKADMGNVGFNGFITYNGDTPNPNDVTVFAPGLRNSYGIALHSNGNLYATDNGPNLGYGDMATGCGPGEQINDKFEQDKVVHVMEGKYYGHPNPTRAAIDNDTRQCVWHSKNKPTSADHEAPIVSVGSSTNGIIEFATNHFVGQMRGNLIVSKYTQFLSRIILNEDGTAVNPDANKPSKLVGNGGLGVTQAPDGTLVEIRYEDNEVFIHKPDEEPYTELSVLSVYPRRGGLAGGQTVQIYGKNFSTGSSVAFGGTACPVVSETSTLITCTVPGGPVGAVDVTVTKVGGESLTFTNAYRYITGVPERR